MEWNDSIGPLVNALAVAHPAEITGTVKDTLARYDGLEATVWIGDIGGSRFTDLSGEKAAQNVEGSLAGRAFRNQETIVSPDHLLTPLESLGRQLGVLELRGAGLADRVDEMQVAAKVITDRLIGARGHSDVVETARGAADLGLAATIQHEMMPIPSYVGRNLEIGGWIEPAYYIAGDAFDYAVNADEVYFGVFDSVGHGIRSCQLSMVGLGSFRLARRRGGSLREIAAEIEDGLGEIVKSGEFVTCALGRVLPEERELELINAGHLAPIRLRDGSATQLEWQPALPLGLDGKNPTTHIFDIQPGDSFYLFSDGVIEAVNQQETSFGLDTLSDLLLRGGAEERPVSTICHLVLDSVVDHVRGPLRDDATLLGLRFR